MRCCWYIYQFNSCHGAGDASPRIAQCIVPSHSTAFYVIVTVLPTAYKMIWSQNYDATKINTIIRRNGTQRTPDNNNNVFISANARSFWHFSLVCSSVCEWCMPLSVWGQMRWLIHFLFFASIWLCLHLVIWYLRFHRLLSMSTITQMYRHNLSFQNRSLNNRNEHQNNTIWAVCVNVNTSNEWISCGCGCSVNSY